VAIAFIGGIIGSILSLIGAINAFRFAFRNKFPGQLSTNETLLQLIGDVTANVEISDFKGVHITADAGMSTMYVSSGRHLLVGVLSLKYLTENELKAVIAHECAHHYHGAMLLNRVHHRNWMFYVALCTACQEVTSNTNRFIKSAGTWRTLADATATFAGLSMLLLLQTYRIYIDIMGVLVRNADYEFYCDAIAIDYIGGNIVASALRKIYDLHLAVSMQPEAPSDDNYLRMLHERYLRIRMSKARFELKSYAMASRTHPPLKVRIERALAKGRVIDLSQPLFSAHDIKTLWRSTIIGLGLV